MPTIDVKVLIRVLDLCEKRYVFVALPEDHYAIEPVVFELERLDQVIKNTGWLSLKELSELVDNAVTLPPGLQIGRVAPLFNMGKELFDLFFPEGTSLGASVRATVLGCLKSPDASVLRLLLNVDANLADVPFEWMAFSGQGALHLLFSISERGSILRTVGNSLYRQIEPILQKPKVLLILANPQVGSLPDISTFVDSQQSLFEGLKGSGLIDLSIVRGPGTKARVIEALSQFKPQVVHIVAHGDAQDVPFLAFEGHSGQLEKMYSQPLASMFQSGHDVRLVFFCACKVGGTVASEYSGESTAWTKMNSSVFRNILSQCGVANVVGMKYITSTEAASAICKEFYAHIFGGETVELAITYASRSLFDGQDVEFGTTVHHVATYGGIPSTTIAAPNQKFESVAEAARQEKEEAQVRDSVETGESAGSDSGIEDKGDKGSPSGSQHAKEPRSDADSSEGLRSRSGGGDAHTADGQERSGSDRTTSERGRREAGSRSPLVVEVGRSGQKLELVNVPSDTATHKFYRGYDSETVERLAKQYRTISNLRAALADYPRTVVDPPLEPYWIGKYEVTNDLFGLFVDETGYRTFAESHGSRASWKDFLRSGPNHPVVNVTKADAERFCAWLGQESGREMRLPSADEWEKAARGLDGRVYPWGNSFSPYRCHTLESITSESTAPVEKYAFVDSPYGASDLLGNVVEWTGSETRGMGTVMGGSWRMSCEVFGLCGSRLMAPLDLFRDDLGFRVCCPDRS